MKPFENGGWSENISYYEDLNDLIDWFIIYNTQSLIANKLRCTYFVVCRGCLPSLWFYFIRVNCLWLISFCPHTLDMRGKKRTPLPNLSQSESIVWLIQGIRQFFPSQDCLPSYGFIVYLPRLLLVHFLIYLITDLKRLDWIQSFWLILPLHSFSKKDVINKIKKKWK